MNKKLRFSDFMPEGASPPQVCQIDASASDLGPVIFEGEDLEAYRSLQQELEALLAPTDLIERMLVDRATRAHWDWARVVRFLPKDLVFREPAALNEIAKCLGIHDTERERMVHGYAVGNEEETARVERILIVTGHDLESVRAKAMAMNLENIAKYEALADTYAKRYEKALRELERYRKAKRRSAKDQRREAGQ